MSPTKRPDRAPKSPSRLFATAVVAALGLAPLAWALLPSRVDLQLARIARTADAEIPPILQQMAYQGPLGLTSLVRLLDDSRDVVASSASQVLTTRLAELLHDAPASDLVAGAVRDLSLRVAHYRPRGKAAANLIANQIIAAQNSATPATSQILFRCENIIRLARVSKSLPGGPSAKPLRPTDEGELANLLGGTPDAVRGIVPEELKSVSPGENRESHAAVGDSSSLSFANRDAERSSPELLPTSPELSPATETAASPGGIQQRGSVGNYQPNTTPTEALRGAAIHPEEQETLRLMEQLRDGGAAAESAAALLRKRGFSERHLELARLMVSPRVDVRKSLVEQIQRERGIDRQVWLMWLAKDSAAEVRLSALVTLATSGDPRLQADVLQMCLTDPDEQVQHLAERLRENGSPRR